MEIKEKSLDLKLNKGHAVCFDFDGVIKDTMRHCSYLLLRLHGIDMNYHSKSNEEDERVVTNNYFVEN